MGCCTTKLSSEAKKRTLRDQTDNQILNNDTKGEQTYVGKKVKEVLDESDIDDLMLAVVNNQQQLVEALCLKFKILNVCEVRGLVGEFELLKREKYDLANWNMILVAIAYNHQFALEFFTQKLQCHLRVALRSPPVLGFSKMQEYSPQQSETFALLVAINNRNEECLKYLWNTLYRLWDNFHLPYVLEECSSHKYCEGIKIILRSETSHNIYQGMRVQDQLAMLNDLILNRQSKRSLEVKETLKEEFSLHPYATIAILVMINDPKIGYTQNSIHMEKALNNLDPAEYARYKYSKNKALFNEQVTKKISEYVTQEENPKMNKFGVNIRHKLENLDQEIVKLKGGFVNLLEYEDVLNKLFEFTSSSDLQGFVDSVKTNDIRLFKRKRLETVKLTNSFGVNRYCYFTPLLSAIQNKCLTIVSFIMERTKCSLRQALCLQSVDNEENFMGQDVNEEYQAYSVLCACANKDEQMLRYLWDDHGTYLWTERHFEPVMRYLIESEWLDGIRIMFRSDLTVQMIKSFTSEERSFFIENMIGDLFNLEKQSVVRVIKEELTFKPYAGLFVVYMLNDFENLTPEDFEFWDTCTDNLYVQELKVLSKTNQSTFSKFILDYYIKHRDDNVKQQAMKFVEKLKELPEYAPIIEEGVEEAIQNGSEEIRFLRKDMKDCKIEFMQEIIKYTITGNIKQIQKIVQKENLQSIDLYDIRGFAVKAYDYEQSIINTREWNVVNFCVFFRQHKLLAYYVDELKLNLKIALDYSHTYNEFIEDPSFLDYIGSYTHLYGLLLAIWTKDLEMLKYLYEEKQDEIQTTDQDLIKMMKMCINSGFSKGFINLLNSSVTQNIFVNASLDGKQEIVQYILSDHCIESTTINSQKTEDIYREVKETLCLWPYSCISWLFIDPVHSQNKRYVQMMIENFDLKAMQTLAYCGQLDKIESQVSRPNIEVDFLANIKDEDDHKEMQEKHAEIQDHRKAQLAHQQLFINKIQEERKKQDLIRKSKLNEICQDIVEQIFQEDSLTSMEKQTRFFEAVKNQKLIQFIDSYYNFQFWRKHPKFQQIEMDKLNILHWVLFFNQSNILDEILKPKDENEEMSMHFGIAFSGDHFDFEYEYNEKIDKDTVHKLSIRKLGVVICVLRQSLECWQKLLNNDKAKQKARFSSQEVLDITLMICSENWKQGLNPFVNFIESAFAKVSLIRRVEFIRKLLRTNNDCFKDVMRIPKVLTFVEWMYENYKSQDNLDLNPTIKTLLPSYQDNKELELQKIGFLARLKPAVVKADINNKQQQSPQQNNQSKHIQLQQSPREKKLIQQVAPNDIVNLNDIIIKPKQLPNVSNAIAKKEYFIPRVVDPSPLKNQNESNDSAEADSD